MNDSRLMDFLVQDLRQQVYSLSSLNKEKTLEIQRLKYRIRELESELATNNIKKNF